jgi:hypothetical protein
MILTEFIIKRTLSEILFGNKITESIEDTQIVNYLYDNMLCEKLLYGENLTIEELRQLLRKKIVNFEFIKLNGDLRIARGSTNLKYVPKIDWPKGTAPQATAKRLKKVATFYDMMKKSWRSVSSKSKEIVLKQDIEKHKPIVVVVDRPKGEEKEKEIIKKQKFTPAGRVEDKKKLLHFRNKITGATIDYNVTKAEAQNKLQQLGANWEIVTDQQLKDKNKELNLMAKPKVETPEKQVQPVKEKPKSTKPIVIKPQKVEPDETIEVEPEETTEEKPKETKEKLKDKKTKDLEKKAEDELKNKK